MTVPYSFKNAVGSIPLSELDDNFTAVVDKISLAASTGATLVKTIQTGTGAVARTVDAKLKETVSVLDFGADPTGATSSTEAFSLAAKGAPAVVTDLYALNTLGIPQPLMCEVLIPSGTYSLPTLVDTGGREVTWIFETGAVIGGSAYNSLNGRLERHGNKVNSKLLYGIRGQSTGFSINSNQNLNATSGVMGFAVPADISTYDNRDSVGFYCENTGVPLLTTIVAPTFTANSLVGSALSADIVKQLRVSMIIDTSHSPKYSGMITGWSADGSTITVSNWYLFVGPGNPVSSPSTPPSGAYDAYVNPCTKIWGLNVNAFLNADSYADAASGFELGVFNNKAAPTGEGTFPKLWGYDCGALGAYKSEAAYVGRYSFYFGFQSIGPDTGFCAQNYHSSAFRSEGDNTALLVKNAALQQVCLIGGSDGHLKIGNTSVANTPYIDFKSSASISNYDARIICGAGNTTDGNGVLGLYSATTNLTSTTLNLTSTTTNLTSTTTNLTTANSAIRIGPYATANIPSLLFCSSGLTTNFDTQIISSGGSATDGRGILTFKAASAIFQGSNFGLVVGTKLATNTPYIDFKSSTLATNYDARIIAGGGTATDGQGSLTIAASVLDLTNIPNIKMNGLVDYANDAAAAAGGIAIGYLYRTSNTIKIRIV